MGVGWKTGLGGSLEVADQLGSERGLVSIKEGGVWLRKMPEPSTCDLHTHTHTQTHTHQKSHFVHGECSPNTNQLLSGDWLLPSACLEPQGLDVQGDYARSPKSHSATEAECVFITVGALPRWFKGLEGREGTFSDQAWLYINENRVLIFSSPQNVENLRQKLNMNLCSVLQWAHSKRDALPLGWLLRTPRHIWFHMTIAVFVEHMFWTVLGVHT